MRRQAGEGEELITDVLDVDALARVREFGTAGVSRMWEQARRLVPGLDLPMYSGVSLPAGVPGPASSP